MEINIAEQRPCSEHPLPRYKISFNFVPEEKINEAYLAINAINDFIGFSFRKSKPSDLMGVGHAFHRLTEICGELSLQADIFNTENTSTDKLDENTVEVGAVELSEGDLMLLGQALFLYAENGPKELRSGSQTSSPALRLAETFVAHRMVRRVRERVNIPEVPQKLPFGFGIRD